MKVHKIFIRMSAYVNNVLIPQDVVTSSFFNFIEALYMSIHGEEEDEVSHHQKRWSVRWPHTGTCFVSHMKKAMTCGCNYKSTFKDW